MNEYLFYRNSKTVIVSSISFAVIIAIILLNYYSTLSLILFVLIPLTGLLIFNFEIIFLLFLTLIFFDGYYYSFALSEIYSIILIISFVINYKVSVTEYKNPFLLGLILFIISIIPSIINSDKALLSGFLSLRLILFTIVLIILTVYFSDPIKQKFAIIGFLTISLINAVVLLVQSSQIGGRSFGFSGVVYVDLIGISIIITLIYFLYQDKNKIFYLLMLFIFIIALIITQTRNAWISTALIILLIWVQHLFKIRRNVRKFYSALSLSLIFIVISFFLIFQLYQADILSFERVNIASLNNNKDVDGYLKTAGSLISRIFIWDTAINAFTAHPISGIGFYTFPILSVNYFSIPPDVYKLYVAGLSPHQTFLAIICETGIVGLIGFSFFLFSTIFKSWRVSVKFDENKKNIFLVLLFWINMYVFFSMLMTDAWLWGRLFMAWCIILGITAANIKSLNYNIKS